MDFNAEDNAVLDRIIENRRSVRAFQKDRMPSREMLEAIIRAGLWAPFGLAMLPPGAEVRKFVVIRSGSPALPKIHALLRQEARKAGEGMAKSFEGRPMPEHIERWVARMAKTAESGLPGFEDAPSLIIVAERRLTMEVEIKSIPHVLQNMWLKATALGLGFQLLSILERLSDSGEFSGILGLPPGLFAYAGGVVGFPAQEPAPGRRPDAKESTSWI